MIYFLYSKLYIFKLFILIILLSSCAKEPLKEDKSNNPNFRVSFLFEYDGIKVYRFYDDGKYHWFTSKGECINSQKKWIQSGKQGYIERWDEHL